MAGQKQILPFLPLSFSRGGEVTDPEARRRIGSMTAVTGIAVNLLLFTTKFIVGTIVRSLSIRADAINNLSDAGSSLISAISFKISSKPADRDHPFGHARIEYIASLIMAFIIIHFSIDTGREAIGRIITPVSVPITAISTAVLLFSISAKTGLYFFYKFFGKKIGSQVVVAAATDSLSDVLTTSAVLVSAIIEVFTGFRTDGIMGLIIAVIIFISGIKILNKAINSLLGAPPDKKTIRQISDFVMSHGEVLGIHDIMLHSYGPGRTFASLHAEVDGKKDVFATHDVIDNIERELSELYGIQCSVHLDPIVTDDIAVSVLHQKVADIVKGVDKNLTVHDFRLVAGPTHSNLIFDVTVPFEFKMKISDFKALVGGKIKEIDKSYYTVITVDRC